jgi:DNA-binding transcriptional ArsR family regulator
MCAVHIATVGETPEPIIEGVRHHSVDLQVLLHSRETKSVAVEIRRRIKSLIGRDICELKEIDPFDMRDIMTAIVSYRKRMPAEVLHINITGGTNIMASAALIAGFVVGARVYYIRKDPNPKIPLADRIIELPVPRVSLESLDENHRRILKLIHNRGTEFAPANSVIATELGMSRQLVSYHLRRLERAGLLHLTLEGRNKIASLTPEGDLYAEIV